MQKVIRLNTAKNAVKLRLVDGNNFTVIVKKKTQINPAFAGKDNMKLLDRFSQKSSTIIPIQSYQIYPTADK